MQKTNDQNSDEYNHPKNLEDKRRENLKLLITIIFTLLLAMAFYADYDASKNAGINIFLRLIFIFGISTITVSFIAYIINNKGFEYLAYLSSIPFLVVLLYAFTGDTFMFKNLFYNFSKYKMFWIISFILIIGIEIILIKIYKRNLKPQRTKHQGKSTNYLSTARA